MGESRWTGLKHRIQPRITYGWVPHRDQSENPIFEEMDRIKPSQQVRLSLNNILTVKKSTVKREKDGYGYNETFSDPIRWELATGYDFEEANRDRYRDEFDRCPVMDTYSYLEFSPLDWLSLSSKMYISMYGNGVTRNDTRLTLRNQRWGSWSISYDVRNKYYTYLDEMKRMDMEIASEFIAMASHLMLIKTKMLLSMVLPAVIMLRMMSRRRRRS